MGDHSQTRVHFGPAMNLVKMTGITKFAAGGQELLVRWNGLPRRWDFQRRSHTYEIVLHVDDNERRVCEAIDGHPSVPQFISSAPL